MLMTPIPMSRLKHLHRFICLSLLSAACASWADDTQAVYFAKQAGVIAGAAEACGQPISLMVMRSGEVINALALNSTDNTYATAAFSKAQQDAHNNMIQSQQIACTQVINDYNNLPLLQPNYKEAVLKPLLATSANASAASTTPAAAPTTSPAVPSPTLPTAAASTANSINPLASQISPPAQNYVAGNNANNPAAMPPINLPQNQQQPQNSNTQNDMARLQLAQQLAQMAQTLVSNNPAQAAVAAGQPPAYNPAMNPQLNQQLNGAGANNPIFTGASLAPPTQITPTTTH